MNRKIYEFDAEIQKVPDIDLSLIHIFNLAAVFKLSETAAQFVLPAAGQHVQDSFFLRVRQDALVPVHPDGPEEKTSPGRAAQPQAGRTVPLFRTI